MKITIANIYGPNDDNPDFFHTVCSHLMEAVLSMPNNKSPGSDGYPIEFYIQFWHLISPLFVRMVNEIKSSGNIPQKMNTAHISVLIKPYKDPTLTSSYSPISLINCNLKIISKTLTNRLESVIFYLIYSDQTGFIRWRHSTSNMRCLFSLITSQRNHLHHWVLKNFLIK